MTIKGKSQKGHSRIGQHGTEWKIVKSQEIVGFSTKRYWFLIQSVKTDYVRWMHHTDDEHFEIV